MTRQTALRFALAAALAASLGPVPAARAELRSWDQAQVTALAGQLNAALKELRQAERREPRPDPDTHARARLKYMNDLKLLEQSGKRLENRLKAGNGREETLPIALRMRTLVRDAEENGRKFLDSEQVTAAVAPVKEALDALAPYYFAESPRGGRGPTAAQPESAPAKPPEAGK